MSKVTVINKFFGDQRKVSMDEFKALSAEERTELADAAAEQMGLKKNVNAEGVTDYV